MAINRTYTRIKNYPADDSNLSLKIQFILSSRQTKGHCSSCNFSKWLIYTSWWGLRWGWWSWLMYNFWEVLGWWVDHPGWFTIFERFWDGGLIILADVQFLRGFGMVGWSSWLDWHNSLVKLTLKCWCTRNA